MFGPQSKLVGPFHLDKGNRLVKRHPSWGVFTKRLATEAYDNDAEAFYDAFLEYLDY